MASRKQDLLPIALLGAVGVAAGVMLGRARTAPALPQTQPPSPEPPIFPTGTPAPPSLPPPASPPASDLPAPIPPLAGLDPKIAGVVVILLDPRVRPDLGLLRSYEAIVAAAPQDARNALVLSQLRGRIVQVQTGAS